MKLVVDSVKRNLYITVISSMMHSPEPRFSWDLLVGVIKLCHSQDGGSQLQEAGQALVLYSRRDALA